MINYNNMLYFMMADYEGTFYDRDDMTATEYLLDIFNVPREDAIKLMEQINIQDLYDKPYKSESYEASRAEIVNLLKQTIEKCSRNNN